MKLMTDEIRNKLPALYTHEHSQPPDVPVVVKYFNPYGAGTWYITEFDGEDMMFGLCCIQEPELRYVSLKELQTLRVFGRFTLERDLHWHGSLADAMKREGYLH